MWTSDQTVDAGVGRLGVVTAAGDRSDPDVTLTWLRRRVSADLDDIWARRREDSAHIGPEVDRAFIVAQRLLSGGKRLRAAFAYLGWAAYSDTETHGPVVRAAVGLELFHLAALVHDDVIDASQQRRGVSAAHRQFSQAHREAQLLGDPEEFGDAAAILLGDLLVVMSTGELAEAAAALPQGPAERTREVVTGMTAEVTMGQYLDIYAQCAPWSSDPARDLDRAYRVVRSKSARYSVEHPMLLGAAMAGADAEQARTASAVGLPIGEAFQMRDDLLGVFGDPRVTGKPSGDDLREGKRTVLITTALTRATPAQADQIRGALGGPLTDDDVANIRQILTTCGAVAEVERLIANRAEQARAVIDESGWPDPAKDLARHLAQAAIARST